MPPHQKTLSPFAFIAWLLGGCFFLYEFFLRTFPAAIHTLLSHDLNLTAVSFAILGSAYYLTYSCMQIPVGMLIDQFGTRRALTAAAACCSLGVLLFSYANTFEMALFGRLLMGLGSAFGFVGMLTISIHWFPPRLLGFLAGATQILGALGPMLSERPLTFTLDHLNNDWRLITLYVAFFGFLLTLLIFLGLRDRKNEIHPQAEQRPQLKTRLCTLLTTPATWWVGLYAFCVYAIIPVMGAVWGISFLETHGFDREMASTIISAIWLGLAIGSPTLGALSDFIGRRKIGLIFSPSLGCLSSLILLFYPHPSATLLSALLFLIGCSASGQTLSFAVLCELLPKPLHATGMGFNNTAVMFSGVLIPPLIGWLISLMPHGFPHAYQFQLALFIVPLISLCAVLIAWFKIDETYCRPQPTQEEEFAKYNN